MTYEKQWSAFSFLKLFESYPLNQLYKDYKNQSLAIIHTQLHPRAIIDFLFQCSALWNWNNPSIYSLNAVMAKLTVKWQQRQWQRLDSYIPGRIMNVYRRFFFGPLKSNNIFRGKDLPAGGFVRTLDNQFSVALIAQIWRAIFCSSS